MSFIPNAWAPAGAVAWISPSLDWTTKAPPACTALNIFATRVYLIEPVFVEANVFVYEPPAA